MNSALYMVEELEKKIAELEAENEYLSEIAFFYKAIAYKTKPRAVELLESRYGHLLKKEGSE